MPGDDLVEGGEILVEQADQRDRLGALGQQGEPLEIGKQDRRSRTVFRLHLAVLLEFIGDRGRQDVGEQLLGARLLGRGFGVGLIQFLDHLLVFDEPAAQLELRDHLPREPAHRFRLLEFEFPRLEVHDAERSERVALLSDERHAAIEFQMRIAGHEWILAEAAVLAQVRNSDQFGPANRRRAKADLARAAEEVGRQAVSWP